MPQRRKMALLDEANSLRGLAADDADLATRVESARRMAIVALVASMLWGFGVLSLAGALAGAGAWWFLRSNDPDGVHRWIALAACLIGSLGLVATLVLVGPSVLGT